MYVEDDDMTNSAIKLAFENEGFKVDGFTDPLLALSAFKANQYDILLLDIRMPGMNGLGLCERIKKMDKDIKVIFITAFEVYYEALKELFRTNSSMNDDQFIQKPIEIAELVQRVKTVFKID
jgi:DNA-binding response OmpR family regulator